MTALLALVLGLPRRAEAHTIGISTGEYTVKGSSVTVKLAFARAEVASLVPGIDVNRDGHLTPTEVTSARGVLRDKVVARIVVTSGGDACAPVLTDAGLTEEDGLLLAGRWDCRTSAAPFDVELALFDDLMRGHRHIARAVTSSETRDRVLSADQRRFSLLPEPSARVESKHPDVSTREPKTGSLFKLGIEHILEGYDHLVFLLGLVLARARVRSLLTIVTAFTVAHSITLALAALDVWVPSSRIVEPAIALSIVYVGIENFFVKDASKRWRITFPFGLIHGFGFAGALREIALPKSSVPLALVSFNLGVEVGQLAVLALLLPLVVYLRKTTWFEPRGMQVASGVIALCGAVWFLARIVSG